MSGSRASSRGGDGAPRPASGERAGAMATSGSTQNGVTVRSRQVMGSVTTATSSRFATTAAAMSGELPVTTVTSSPG